VYGEVRRTSFPRAEECIRPILDAFLACVRRSSENQDYTPPQVYSVRWTAGARELYEVLKGDPWQFMPWAFEEYRKAFPDHRPLSPKSLMYLVDRWHPVELCPGCGQVPEYCLCEEAQHGTG
jgi:hypothetical protein